MSLLNWYRTTDDIQRRDRGERRDETGHAMRWGAVAKRAGHAAVRRRVDRLCELCELCVERFVARYWIIVYRLLV